MTTQKYLCPPRLQKKFLLWWWTVPELIGIALGAVLVFYLRSPQIFTLTCFLALGTARFDFENNLFGALKMRTAYQFFTKTFSRNAVVSGKDEKRRKKKLRRLMKSKLPMQDLLQFRFGENGIYGGKDGKELFRFYRYYPPNTDVMTDDEIAQEIEQLCRLFDSLRCPFVMFGTDKVEDMSALKAYYRSQPRQFDHIIADVINEIESTEARSSSVQRAYYFIYKAQNEDDDIYNLIAGKGYKIERVKNEELAVLLRNYLVREFTNVDLYTIAEEVKNYPDMARAKPAVYNKEIQRRLCPNRIDFTKDHAEQSGVLRRTLMIKNFPSQIPPRALYTVASMRNTSFTMRLTPLQKDSARKLINEQLRNKAVMAGKHQATEQIDAMQEANDIQNFYSEITRNQNTVYSINIYIEIYGKTLDALNDLEQQVKIELAGAGSSAAVFSRHNRWAATTSFYARTICPARQRQRCIRSVIRALSIPTGCPSGVPTGAARCMLTSSSGTIRSPMAYSLSPALPGRAKAICRRRFLRSKWCAVCIATSWTPKMNTVM